MTNRIFNKLLNSCRQTKSGVLNKAALAVLPDETKHAMAMKIIRNNAPLIVDLITPLMDRAWLDCMGYLNTTDGKTFTFRHRSEQAIS